MRPSSTSATAVLSSVRCRRLAFSHVKVSAQASDEMCEQIRNRKRQDTHGGIHAHTHSAQSKRHARTASEAQAVEHVCGVGDVVECRLGPVAVAARRELTRGLPVSLEARRRRLDHGLVDRGDGAGEAEEREDEAGVEERALAAAPRAKAAVRAAVLVDDALAADGELLEALVLQRLVLAASAGKVGVQNVVGLRPQIRATLTTIRLCEDERSK